MIKKGKDAIEGLLNNQSHQEKENLVVVLRIGEILKSRDITQTQLSEMTGIRQAAISSLSRGIVERLNLEHINKIVNALNINDINEVITLVTESEAWNMSNVKEQKEYLSNKKGDSE